MSKSVKVLLNRKYFKMEIMYTIKNIIWLTCNQIPVVSYIFKGKWHQIEYLHRKQSAAHLSEVYCMELLVTNNTGLSLVLLAKLLLKDKKSEGNCQTKAKNNTEL